MALLAPRKPRTPKGFVANPKGKPKGTKNRTTIAKEQLGQEAIDAGMLPLEYALLVLRGDSKIYNRFDRQWAASIAMPYLHKKQPIAIEGGDKPIKVIDASKLADMSTEQLDKMLAALAALGVVDNE